MGSSVSNFGASQADGKSFKSGSMRDPKEDSFDLEDFGEVVESIQLQSALEEQKRMIGKVKEEKEDGYKDCFLV